ncbi:MAG TPA: phosphoribosylanthranilate isomerase [Candidatus Pelagibacter sp.]|jgi:phosphoribosylanthranilate isomerase|nr:phosphoribosylanthranilate isomerase [Candidatus Pelagibacter sp.]
MPLELKICGIKSERIIKTISKIGGCQYLGFVFYDKSPRNLSIEQSKKLTSIVPGNINKVAVLVNPENDFVEKIKDQFDLLQVYNTSPERVEKLKLISNKKIIQAIKVKRIEDINIYKKYIGIADGFLFDSSGMEKSSTFNWDFLKNIEIKDWFLAGGINISNLDRAKNITQKIDISSSLEDNPGEKSVQKVSDFLLKIKKI